MKNSKSTKMIEQVLTIEEATKRLGNQSALARAVGKPNQNYKRWPGKKLVARSGDAYCLVEDNEFFRALL